MEPDWEIRFWEGTCHNPSYAVSVYFQRGSRLWPNPFLPVVDYLRAKGIEWNSGWEDSSTVCRFWDFSYESTAEAFHRLLYFLCDNWESLDINDGLSFEELIDGMRQNVPPSTKIINLRQQLNLHPVDLPMIVQCAPSTELELKLS